jgi:hypothetical protein
MTLFSTPSQGGIRFIQIVQSTASTTWSINHNFGAFPMIEVFAYDDAGVLQKAFPWAVDQVDVNNLTISWTSPRHGYVTLADTTSTTGDAWTQPAGDGV